MSETQTEQEALDECVRIVKRKISELSRSVAAALLAEEAVADAAAVVSPAMARTMLTRDVRERAVQRELEPILKRILPSYE